MLLSSVMYLVNWLSSHL